MMLYLYILVLYLRELSLNVAAQVNFDFRSGGKSDDAWLFSKSPDRNPNSNLLFQHGRDAFLICAVADIFYFAVESNYCQDILQPPTLLHTVRRLSARLRLEEMEVFVRQWGRALTG